MRGGMWGGSGGGKGEGSRVAEREGVGDRAWERGTMNSSARVDLARGLDAGSVFALSWWFGSKELVVALLAVGLAGDGVASVVAVVS